MMKTITQQVKIIFLGIIVALGMSYAFAWTGPSSSPPAGNVDAPINVGPSIQTKYGSLILNASSTSEYPTGLTVFGQSIFDGSIQIADGTQGAGKVLVSDANGNASWASSTGGGGPAGQSCPSSEYVTGFDGAGNIICSYTAPMASIKVYDDEQVYIHLQGTKVTLTNETRNGASLTSAAFADSVNGMPQDGKPLAISNLITGDASGKLINCPEGTSTPMVDSICVAQQPTAANSYETIVKIFDSAAGAHSWAFNLGYAQ